MIAPENSGVGLPRAFFVVLAIISPMGLMVVLSLVLSVRKWFFARKKKVRK